MKATKCIVRLQQEVAELKAQQDRLRGWVAHLQGRMDDHLEGHLEDANGTVKESPRECVGDGRNAYGYQGVSPATLYDIYRDAARQDSPHFAMLPVDEKRAWEGLYMRIVDYYHELLKSRG